MFKTALQITDIVDNAKAYNYEQAQSVMLRLQVGIIDTEYEDDVLKINAEIRNLIKSLEFIGSNITDNNILSDRLQKIIK